MGKRVPEDIKVVGFDDTVIAGITTPSITTIHQPIEEMSELSIAYIEPEKKGRDGAECDDHAGEPCWMRDYGRENKNEKKTLRKKETAEIFFCPAVNDRQKNSKKTKKKPEIC